MLYGNRAGSGTRLITLVQSFMRSAMLGRIRLGLVGQCNITINFRHFVVVIYLICDVIALHNVLTASRIFSRNFLLLFLRVLQVLQVTVKQVRVSNSKSGVTVNKLLMS